MGLSLCYHIGVCPFIQQALIRHQHASFRGSVQSLSHVQLFVTPWTAARQASLSITNSWSLLKLMSIEEVMPAGDTIVNKADTSLKAVCV